MLSLCIRRTDLAYHRTAPGAPRSSQPQTSQPGRIRSREFSLRTRVSPRYSGSQAPGHSPNTRPVRRPLSHTHRSYPFSPPNSSTAHARPPMHVNRRSRQRGPIIAHPPVCRTTRYPAIHPAALRTRPDGARVGPVLLGYPEMRPTVQATPRSHSQARRPMPLDLPPPPQAVPRPAKRTIVLPCLCGQQIGLAHPKPDPGVVIDNHLCRYRRQSPKVLLHREPRPPSQPL